MKKDSVWYGVALGALVPIFIFGLLELVLYITWQRPIIGVEEDLSLFSIAINAILVRQFMFKWELDETGKGIIASTLFIVIIWFAFFKL